jgi:thymidylate synthase (FAD)
MSQAAPAPDRITNASATSNEEEATLTPRRIELYDHGFIELVDSMGSDLTIVNSARVSFGKRKSKLSEGDVKLISYLAEHKHWSPFRHVQFQFHCKIPEFVARQWYKHVVGIAYSEQPTVDHAWNEISMRYVDASDFDFYTPSAFRAQSENNRQASTDATLDDPTLLADYQKHCETSLAMYHRLIENGVAREQARCLLPLSIYTEFYWTVSLQALAHFIHLRRHEGAQYEIRLAADALEQLAQVVTPIALKALAP